MNRVVNTVRGSSEQQGSLSILPNPSSCNKLTIDRTARPSNGTHRPFTNAFLTAIPSILPPNNVHPPIHAQHPPRNPLLLRPPSLRIILYLPHPKHNPHPPALTLLPLPHNQRRRPGLALPGPHSLLPLARGPRDPRHRGLQTRNRIHPRRDHHSRERERGDQHCPANE